MGGINGGLVSKRYSVAIHEHNTVLIIHFWSELCKEHGLDTEGELHRLTNQNEKLQVYFDEIDGRRFVPRALLMDLEPGAIDEVQFGAYGNVFSPDKMLRGALPSKVFSTYSEPTTAFRAQKLCVDFSVFDVVSLKTQSYWFLSGE
ncbi:Tubulin beta chain [Toxocara canis]|uniref:Tubulin beta chain n=1 Tax=Toxocara canis TaxID=6265 RepID=A0A0B2V1L5_TOXCA|nr:Tubulin beta chain [Toxocara canis]